MLQNIASTESLLRFFLGDGVVVKPHSFDVKITAKYKNKTFNRTFASYEERTSIDYIIAEKNGVKTESAANKLMR